MKKKTETSGGSRAASEDDAVAVAERAPATREAAVEAVAGPCGDAAAAVKRKPRGRPLSFDRDAALETAMHVFWERGYEAASIADLTSAMGITPPSLYTAFGDKEHLFLETVERYALNFGSAGARALKEEATAHGAIERWLLEAANELTEPCHPKGCMVVMAATNCSAAAERVQDALLLRRTENLAEVSRRIQGGIDKGELPANTCPVELANFYGAVFQGMSMQAKDGATREALLRTVKTAMRAWPTE